MNIRMGQFGDYFWNYVVINGRTYMLRKLGRLRECIRP